jgi:carboxylate-amine ligase
VLTFNSSPGPTIGVEVELQLLDHETLAFKNVAPEVLRSMDPAFEGRIKEEFIKCMVELNTRVCGDVAEVEKDQGIALAP